MALAGEVQGGLKPEIRLCFRMVREGLEVERRKAVGSEQREHCLDMPLPQLLGVFGIGCQHASDRSRTNGGFLPGHAGFLTSGTTLPRRKAPHRSITAARCAKRSWRKYACVVVLPTTWFSAASATSKDTWDAAHQSRKLDRKPCTVTP